MRPTVGGIKLLGRGDAVIDQPEGIKLPLWDQQLRSVRRMCDMEDSAYASTAGRSQASRPRPSIAAARPHPVDDDGEDRPPGDYGGKETSDDDDDEDEDENEGDDDCARETTPNRANLGLLCDDMGVAGKMVSVLALVAEQGHPCGGTARRRLAVRCLADVMDMHTDLPRIVADYWAAPLETADRLPQARTPLFRPSHLLALVPVPSVGLDRAIRAAGPFPSPSSSEDARRGIVFLDATLVVAPHHLIRQWQDHVQQYMDQGAEVVQMQRHVLSLVERGSQAADGWFAARLDEVRTVLNAAGEAGGVAEAQAAVRREAAEVWTSVHLPPPPSAKTSKAAAPRRGGTGGHTLVLCNANRFKSLAHLCGESGLGWARVVVDELSDVKLPGCATPHYRFLWGLTGTPGNLHKITCTGFLRDTFRHLTPAQVAAVAVRNDVECVRPTFEAYPPYKLVVVRCARTPLQAVIEELARSANELSDGVKSADSEDDDEDGRAPALGDDEDEEDEEDDDDAPAARAQRGRSSRAINASIRRAARRKAAAALKAKKDGLRLKRQARELFQLPKDLVAQCVYASADEFRQWLRAQLGLVAKEKLVAKHDASLATTGAGPRGDAKLSDLGGDDDDDEDGDVDVMSRVLVDGGGGSFTAEAYANAAVSAARDDLRRDARRTDIERIAVLLRVKNAQHNLFRFRYLLCLGGFCARCKDSAPAEEKEDRKHRLPSAADRKGAKGKRKLSARVTGKGQRASKRIKLAMESRSGAAGAEDDEGEEDEEEEDKKSTAARGSKDHKRKGRDSDDDEEEEEEEDQATDKSVFMMHEGLPVCAACHAALGRAKTQKKPSDKGSSSSSSRRRYASGAAAARAVLAEVDLQHAKADDSRAQSYQDQRDRLLARVAAGTSKARRGALTTTELARLHARYRLSDQTLASSRFETLEPPAGLLAAAQRQSSPAPRMEALRWLLKRFDRDREACLVYAAHSSGSARAALEASGVDFKTLKGQASAVAGYREKLMRGQLAALLIDRRSRVSGTNLQFVNRIVLCEDPGADDLAQFVTRAYRPGRDPTKDLEVYLFV